MKPRERSLSFLSYFQKSTIMKMLLLVNLNHLSSTLQLFAWSFLHFWQNTRISFSRWTMGFSEQAQQPTRTHELFMGCCRTKKKNQISPNVWLNIYINNNYNNLFVSSFVNPAIQNNFQGNCRAGLGTTISGIYKRMGTRVVKIASLWFEIFYHEEEKML